MALFDAKYYAPDFSIKISGSDLVKDKYIPITEVSIDIKIGEADNFSFTVQDELENGENKWMKNSLFKEGNEVTIKMGYVGNITLSTVGHISKLTPNFAPSVAPQFTVTGLHKGFTKMTQPTEQETYLKKKDSDIVSAIAGQVGLSPQVDATTTQWENKKKASDKSFVEFIKDMVKQNMQYEFCVADGKLIFAKAKTSGGPAVTLKWGETISQFKPKKENSKIISGVTIKWKDQVKNEAILGEAAASDEISVGDGSKNAAKFVQDKVTVISNLAVVDNNDAKARAKAILQNTNRYFVTGDGEVTGIPDIKPGIMIKVEHIEEKYPTTYYVYGAKHTINSSGYKTNFNVRSNTYNAS